MPKTRNRVPKKIEDAVRREFNHRCAACGADKPQVHHIDGDPTNNDPMNLIPLCPNCHLGGQHDASNAIPQAILAFFRRHKHRLILAPQFRPLWNRMAFLHDVPETAGVGSLRERADELTGLVFHLAMGGFYAEQIGKLLKAPLTFSVLNFGGGADAQSRTEMAKLDREYRQQVRDACSEVERLVVEILNFQNWPPVGTQGNPR